MLSHIQQPFFLSTGSGQLILWNKAMEQICGLDGAQLATMTTWNLIPSPLPEATLHLAGEVLETGESRTQDSELISHVEGPGSPIPVRITFSRIETPESDPFLLIQMVNQTEQQRLEAELRQSQKMEAIGKLAGGIAHDFNNALTTILGLTESMMNGFTQPNSGSLREIYHAADHAATLTHHLLAFSRRQILQMRNVQLDGVIRNFGKMLARLIGEDVRLEIKAQPGLPPIRADESQIEQVILNLCLNARDAMVQGGRLGRETQGGERR